MENSPLVSVLMTVYNREKYIAAAIESVLASTYTNWELIIVDDRSKDSSVEIANNFAAKDERIKVYVNENNLGDYPNRNKAASYARGKYLKYVDADDLIYPYGLEQLVYYMEQFPEAGYGLCSLPQDDDQIYPYVLKPQEAYKRHYLTKKWIFHKAPLSSIIRTDIFNRIGGFKNKRMVGDFEFWHRLSQNFQVVLLPAGIVWHRSHSEQEMNDIAQFYFDYIKISLDYVSHENSPLNVSEQTLITKIVHKKLARFILSKIKSKSFKEAMKLKKQSQMSWQSIIIKAFNI